MVIRLPGGRTYLLVSDSCKPFLTVCLSAVPPCSLIYYTGRSIRSSSRFFCLPLLFRLLFFGLVRFLLRLKGPKLAIFLSLHALSNMLWSSLTSYSYPRPPSLDPPCTLPMFSLSFHRCPVPLFFSSRLRTLPPPLFPVFFLFPLPPHFPCSRFVSCFLHGSPTCPN